VDPEPPNPNNYEFREEYCERYKEWVAAAIPVEVEQASPEQIELATKTLTGPGESNGNTTRTDGSTRAPQLTYTRTHLRCQRLETSRGSGGGDEFEGFFAQHKRSDRLLVATGNDQGDRRQALCHRSTELAAKTHIGIEFE